MTENWVLDVGTSLPGLRAFCPMEDDGSVLVGMTMVTDFPPGRVVGVFHPDGQDALDEYCEDHQDDLIVFFEQERQRQLDRAEGKA